MLSTEVSDSGQPAPLKGALKKLKAKRKHKFSDTGSESGSSFVNRLMYVDDHSELESPYDDYMSNPSIHGR